MSDEANDVVRGSPAEVYDRYIAQVILSPWADDLVRRAAPQPGERVLDIACGTGLVTRLAAQAVGPTSAVTGVDISAPMLAIAAAKPAQAGAAIEWREGSATALPVASGSYDLVLCQQGLQFFPDRPAAVREMARALKPGGRLWLNVWADLSQSPGSAAIEAAAQRQLGISVMTAPYALSDAGELRALLTDGGFRDVTIEPVRLAFRSASVDVYVRNLLNGAAAVLQNLAALSAEERATVNEAILAEVRTALTGYVGPAGLELSGQSNVATAHV